MTKKHRKRKKRKSPQPGPPAERLNRSKPREDETAGQEDKQHKAFPERHPAFTLISAIAALAAIVGTWATVSYNRTQTRILEESNRAFISVTAMMEPPIPGCQATAEFVVQNTGTLTATLEEMVIQNEEGGFVVNEVGGTLGPGTSTSVNSGLTVVFHEADIAKFQAGAGVVPVWVTLHYGDPLRDERVLETCFVFTGAGTLSDCPEWYVAHQPALPLDWRDRPYCQDFELIPSSCFWQQ